MWYRLADFCFTAGLVRLGMWFLDRGIARSLRNRREPETVLPTCKVEDRE